MSFLIGCSIIFSVYTITDFEKEKEMYEITKDVYEFTERMNRDYQGLGYMKWSNELVLSEKFPIKQTEIYNDIGNSKIVIIGRGTENSFDNLAGYLSFAESEKMTHLVLDGNNLDTEFLKNIFIYLIKETHERVYDIFSVIIGKEISNNFLAIILFPKSFV